MGEKSGEQAPFRFLTDGEFQRLGFKDRAIYLVRAQQELEERQRLLRDQRKELTKQIAKNGS